MVYRGWLFGATTIADGVMNLIAIFPTLRKGTPALNAGDSIRRNRSPYPELQKEGLFHAPGRQDIDVLALPDAGASH